MTSLFPELEGAAGLADGLLQAPRFVAPAPVVSVLAASWAEEALRRGGIDRALLDRAGAIAARLCREQLGGESWAEPPGAPVPDQAVLVFAPPAARAARAMLAAVLAEAAPARVVLILPAGGPRLTVPGGTVLRSPVDPWPLLARAAGLHSTGDHPAALLGLAAGVPVHCHAPGLAAGWGATHDRPGVPPRGVARTAPDILAAVLLIGTRYADPFTGRRVECEAVLDQLAEWRRITAANREIGCLAGMSFWKRRRMAQFFHTGTDARRGMPPIRSGADAARRAAGGKIVACWSSRIPPGLDTKLARVEDGFVRSVGLGSDFLPPCSVVLDRLGIYYDPSRPSELERILAETEFAPALLDRARALIARLVASGVTKYAAAGAATPVLDAAPGRLRVLVPGQVADDLSVRLGGAGVAGNLDLLKRVRAARPDAHIAYKPHPDVLAGHRPGMLDEQAVRRYADQIVTGGSMAALIGAADELHTMTSLAGFEALLRGRAVIVYGQPFYAGWGLTQDMAPVPRRRRGLSLEELAAGTLLVYPRYLDPVSGLPCPPEVLLDRLADPGLWRGSLLSRARQVQGRLRHRLKGWRPAFGGGRG